MSLSWIEISKSALTNSVSRFRKIIGKAKLMAVVKANAYGHGVDLVAPAVNDVVDWFGVASGEEAVALRDLGISKPILVLSYYGDELEELLRKNISLAIYDELQIKQIEKAAAKLKTKANVHIKIDTGTSRLGITEAQIPEYLSKVKSSQHLNIEGLFSHFAASEEDQKFTDSQFDRFEKASPGLDVGYKHISCTAAILSQPLRSTNLVRLGIGLYGLWPSAQLQKKMQKQHQEQNFLTPVLTFKTKIIQVKHLSKGSFVGYGLTYKTTKPTTLAVLPVGYNEGYDRKLSNKGEVLINSAKCPVRGRICMNLMMVDVTKAGDVKAGDEVVLIGQQGGNEITVDDLAAKIDTINYEVVTRLNPSIPRSLVA